jgi:hypothetical protein
MEELMKISKERGERFKEVKGLIQKYYVSDKSSNHVGGVYIFDSKRNLKAFRESDLSKSTAEAYQFLEPADERVLGVIKTLREKEEVITLVG